MGEYAIRNSDDVEIKIGTCEDMLYLRYEDRYKVRKMAGSLDPADRQLIGILRFRLPFADEDDIRPGEYQDYDRGLRLSRDNQNFTDDSHADQPGLIQLHHDCGLLLNVPCYHGAKLPEVGGEVKAFWNGRSWFWELFQLKPMPDGIVYPIVGCRHCGMRWRYDWADIWEYVPQDMRAVLRCYADAPKVA